MKFNIFIEMDITKVNAKSFIGEIYPYANRMPMMDEILKILKSCETFVSGTSVVSIDELAKRMVKDFGISIQMVTTIAENLIKEYNPVLTLFDEEI